MPESSCTGCGRLLRVGDEHAGMKARCPICHTINEVPSNGDRGFDGESQWYMKTPEGQTYGPSSKLELDGWVSEGRVTADCQLRQGEYGSWTGASAVFPSLLPTASSYSPSRGVQITTHSPVHRPAYTAAHRGGLILAFGIIGWLFCIIFSICAWVMGSSDLREMRAGRMDPSGMGLTQAGMILGMIQTLLLIVGVIVALFIFLVAAVTAGL